MQDKNQEKRIKLGQEIIKLEQQEEDHLRLKRRYEENLTEYYVGMQDFNFRIENLQTSSPSESTSNRDALESNYFIQQSVRQYVDNELERLEQASKKYRHSLEDKREKLIKERNDLPWE